MMQRWRPLTRVPDDTPPEEIDLTGITTADIPNDHQARYFDFLDHARSADNGPKAPRTEAERPGRAFSTIAMCTQVNRLPANPTENISLGSPAGLCPNI